MDAGTFRSDLYYRLNVHRIHMPPLRERAGDLRLLIDHFLEQVRPRRRDRRRAAIARGRRCCAYDYPGNVRQLEHIIQRAVAIARRPDWSSAICPRSSRVGAPGSARHPRARSPPPASGPNAR